MDKLHHYRASIAEALSLIRTAVRQARANAPDDIDQRQAAVLLTKLEEVEDRARRMLGEPRPKWKPSESQLTHKPPTAPGLYWAHRAEDQGREAGAWVTTRVDVNGICEWLGVEQSVTHRRFVAWLVDPIHMPTAKLD